MGGLNHGHTILARSEFVPRDNVVGGRATKVLSALSVGSVESSDLGSNPEGHERYQIDYLEAHVDICIRNGIAEETMRKVTWTKSIKESSQLMFIMLVFFPPSKRASHD